MSTAQIRLLINLGALLIPLVVLAMVALALRFDTNRLSARPSHTRNVVARYHLEAIVWKVFISLLTIFLVGVLAFLGLSALTEYHLLPWEGIPAASSVRQQVTAIFALLALFAIFTIRQLQERSIKTWDKIRDTHLNFGDWLIVHSGQSRAPMSVTRRWRFVMKWSYKTNLEPIYALQLRLILDHSSFDRLLEHAEDPKYPESAEFPRGFRDVLNMQPWGPAFGSIRRILRNDVAHHVFCADQLWELWEGMDNPHTGVPIVKRTAQGTAGKPYLERIDMCRMLYDELRSLLVCNKCNGEPNQRSSCLTCRGSGAMVDNKGIPLCRHCHGVGYISVGRKASQCSECLGLGLDIRTDADAIPTLFLERLHYLWVSRNNDLIEGLYPVWLSRGGFVIIFCSLAVSFLGIAAVLDTPLNLDTFVEAILFASCVFVGLIGVALLMILAITFHSEASFAPTYPLQHQHLGDTIWTNLGNLVGYLSFAAFLLGTSYVLAQYIYSGSSDFNLPVSVFYSLVLVIFAVSFSLLGIYQLQIGMRESKKAQLAEFENYFDKHDDAEYASTLVQYFRETRDLRVWPISTSLLFAMVSGVVVPILVPVVNDNLFKWLAR